MAHFTKDAIKSTFLKLLDEKPLSKITVREIVEECGINRNSFYYHYSDIPALIEEIVREEADAVIAAHPTIDSIETCLLLVADYAGRNRRALLHVYRSTNRELFEQYLWKVCDYVVTRYGETIFSEQENEIDKADKEIILAYYRSLCFGMTITWMNGGMQDDIQEKIARLCHLKEGMTAEMIRRSKMDT